MEVLNPEVLISEEEIALRILDLGNAITKDFNGEDIVVICVLKGAFMFCSDLIKKIHLPVNLEFVSVSSYGDGMTSSGNVSMDLDLSVSIKDK